MFGSHSLVRIVASFTVFTFYLLMAATVGAQTPPASDAIVAVPNETTRPATVSPKAETDSATSETAPATTAATAPVQQQCTRTVKAEVVAIPKAIMLNRLGATIPNAFVFALKADTIPTGSTVQLRPGKRPRPIVLRANVGDCLRIFFTNAIPQAAFDS